MSGPILVLGQLNFYTDIYIYIYILYIYIYIYIIMKSEELKYYIYFHCFNFHVFTLRSLSEYRCDTNFY